MGDSIPHWVEKYLCEKVRKSERQGRRVFKIHFNACFSIKGFTSVKLLTTPSRFSARWSPTKRYDTVPVKLNSTCGKYFMILYPAFNGACDLMPTRCHHCPQDRIVTALCPCPRREEVKCGGGLSAGPGIIREFSPISLLSLDTFRKC